MGAPAASERETGEDPTDLPPLRRTRSPDALLRLVAAAPSIGDDQRPEGHGPLALGPTVVARHHESDVDLPHT